jgi:hypothetical protein
MTIDLTTPNHPTVCTVTCQFCGLTVRANTLADANRWMAERHLCRQHIHAAVQHACRDRVTL